MTQDLRMTRMNSWSARIPEDQGMVRDIPKPRLDPAETFSRGTAGMVIGADTPMRIPARSLRKRDHAKSF